MKLEARSPDLERLAEELEDFDRDAETEIYSSLSFLGIAVEGRVIDDTPVGATNELRGSIFYDIRGTGLNMYALVSHQARHGLPVEEGSKPHMPPIEALKAWAAYKLGDENLAYAVAKSIAAKGTKEVRMFETAFDKSQSDIKQEATELPRRIMERSGY